ncbi:S8 family serine peptidase [Miltoncostaea marina]|uniref:S8 family serine peptidase n=1 Tax=Miltoncostaea marina TaxID=2843215 RepID=UPI001C3D7DC2|nr:S8 family serine peptidase [Miltoncostaea marina]
MLRRPIVALSAACALGAAALGGAGAGERPAAPAPSAEPAPPPAVCRTPPAGAWPAVGDAGAVPDLTPYQDHLGALGAGGAARGAGVRIADVEYEWRERHVELAGRGLAAGPLTGLPPEYRSADHGTAVLGILGGEDDGAGISGIAPDAELVPVAPHSAAGGYRPAEAIRDAAARLAPGDVLLVELQGMVAQGPADPGVPRYTPIEFLPGVRAAIREAVDAGITVVEPAGNGDGDIGALAPWLAGPDAPDHSGAIVVGAGGGAQDDSPAADRQRIEGSNFGARVDLQGHGAGVVTSGYGDAGWGASGDRSYTACFDGTSSAAATVAGAVAVVQSAEIARDGTPLTPAEVRDLLVATGAPQVAPEEGRIGPRPDVAAAVARLGAGLPASPPAGEPAPPPSPPPAPPAPATAPAVTAVAPAAGAAGARVRGARAVRRVAAVRRVRASVDRRAGRLVLRLSGLAPRATVRVGGRRVRVARGRAVVRDPRLRRAATRRLIVTVTAPRRAGVTYAGARMRVVVPPRGAPRVARLRG